MIESGDRAGFPFEALRKLLAGNLDGDNAVEARVARLVHFPHSAGANGREDFVGAETVSGVHCAVAPFLSNSVQLTITVSGCGAGIIYGSSCIAHLVCVRRRRSS